MSAKICGRSLVGAHPLSLSRNSTLGKASKVSFTGRSSSILHSSARGVARRHETSRDSSSQLHARRSSHLAASTSYTCAAASTAEETDYYEDLTRFAQGGDYEEAEHLLHRMVENGLDLTPQAYHGLIFSCVKAGNVDEAVEVLFTMIETGVQPVTESFAVLIYSLVMNEDLDSAEAVYNSLSSSGADQYPGWLSYLRGLVSLGLLEDDEEDRQNLSERMLQLMEAGRLEGWYADADLYEDILGLLCEDPEKALVAEQMLFDDLQIREGVEAETRHFNTILRAEAVWMGTHHALATLDEMIEGQMGRHVRPDIGSYNALIEGCLVERMQGFGHAVPVLEGVVADAIRFNVQMNKRTHTLLLMFYIEDANMDRVLFELGEMQRLAAPMRLFEHLPDHWLERLVYFMLDCDCIIELTKLMYMMREELRPLPMPLLYMDSDSLNFYTRWLPVFMAGQHLNRRTEGLSKYEEGQEEVTLVNDQWLNSSNAIVDKDSGVEVPVAELTLAELRAELEAKELSTKGYKVDLVRRVQGSRGNQPRSIKETIQLRAAEAALRAAKDDEKQMGIVEAEGMQLVRSYIQEWNYGRMTRSVVETSLLEPEARAIQEEEKAFEELNAMDIPQNVKDLLKERRKAFNRKDAEAEFELDHWIFDTDAPEFKAVNPNFEGRDGYGRRLTWPVWGRGARLAFYMMELALDLGAGASFQDFSEILMVSIEEADVETAVAVSVKMYFESDLNFAIPDHFALFYSKALMLCLQESEWIAAGTIAEIMISLQLEPEGILDEEGLLDSIHALGMSVLDRQEEAERQEDIIQRLKASSQAAAQNAAPEGGEEAELENLSGAKNEEAGNKDDKDTSD